ncbi:unnamed protein product [Jaminaea pallidilutea]
MSISSKRNKCNGTVTWPVLDLTASLASLSSRLTRPVSTVCPSCRPPLIRVSAHRLQPLTLWLSLARSHSTLTRSHAHTPAMIICEYRSLEGHNQS